MSLKTPIVLSLLLLVLLPQAKTQNTDLIKKQFEEILAAYPSGFQDFEVALEGSELGYVEPGSGEGQKTYAYFFPDEMNEDAAIEKFMFWKDFIDEIDFNGIPMVFVGRNKTSRIEDTWKMDDTKYGFDKKYAGFHIQLCLHITGEQHNLIIYFGDLPE